MRRADRDELDRVLAAASAVVAMVDVHRGATRRDVIGLRHDVDANPGSLDTAVKIAAWEHEHGYRATFFMLHTASYWQRGDFPAALDAIAGYGHEIGIHANAISAAITGGGKPAAILAEAITELRDHGHDIVGVAPHGDRLCYHADRSLRYVNDEIFTECARPELGPADREIAQGVRLEPKPLASFGLEYETYKLPHGRYLSDSGGRWNIPPDRVASGTGQLHILWHPDWWKDVFDDAQARSPY